MSAFPGWTPRPRCVLCGANETAGLQRHHKVFRSQGGGEGENLALVCKVCHDAIHGIPTTYNGHACGTCPVLKRYGCYFGEKITGRPVVTPVPWS